MEEVLKKLDAENISVTLAWTTLGHPSHQFVQDGVITDINIK